MKKSGLLCAGLLLGFITLIINFFVSIHIFENTLPSDYYHASMTPIAIGTFGMLFVINTLIYIFVRKKAGIWLKAYLISSTILNLIFIAFASTVHFYVS